MTTNGRRSPLAQRPLLVLTLGIAIALSPGCRERKPAIEARPSHPTLLVGFDGLEWNAVQRLVASGRMPTVGALMAEGTHGDLTVTKPTLSPIIWTSIATGVGSRKHGIRGFVHGSQKTRDDRGRSARLVNSNDRRVKAFWNIVSEAGLRVHTIGWWLTYPVERINGVMVAQVNTVTPAMRRAGRGVWKGRLVEGLTGQIHPPEREASLLALLPRAEAEAPGLMSAIFGALHAAGGSVPAAMLEQSAWAFRADSLYHRVALDVLRNDAPFDLLAVYFGGADVVGHRFWRHAYPDLYRFPPSPEEIEAFSSVLDDYYAYLDAVLGSLIQAAPADVNVIVVSDHGMRPIRQNARYRKPALSGGHLSAPPALLVAAGPDIRRAGGQTRGPTPERRSPLGSILDVTPTLLALLGIPVGRDMDGEPMPSLLSRDFLAAHPVREVAGHTEPGWYETRPKPAVGDEGAAERIEQLRALGYLSD